MPSNRFRLRAGFALVAVSLAWSATVHAAVVGEEIHYQVDGVDLTGYIAWDDAIEGQRPGVLVVHEWWGHNDYVRRRADMLAELGYTAMALDMYGDGKTTSHPEDAKKFMMEVFSNMEAGTARFVAARDLLHAHASTDPGRTAAIGYCFGGNIVLQMARRGMDLDGVASFHGNLSTQVPAEPGAIQGSLLVLHGAADPLVPEEQVAAFKEEMANAGADMTFIAYPGALHAFTNPAADELGKTYNMPIAYDADADRQSWAELQTFLGTVFQ